METESEEVMIATASGSMPAFLCRPKARESSPVYGMVLDEWIEAVENITVPVYLFFGDADPFIPVERVREIETRFIRLRKPYQLKLYSGANHGFFCDERESYNERAALDSWHELMQFFSEHLKRAA